MRFSKRMKKSIAILMIVVFLVMTPLVSYGDPITLGTTAAAVTGSTAILPLVAAILIVAGVGYASVSGFKWLEYQRQKMILNALPAASISILETVAARSVNGKSTITPEEMATVVPSLVGAMGVSAQFNKTGTTNYDYSWFPSSGSVQNWKGLKDSLGDEVQTHITCSQSLKTIPATGAQFPSNDIQINLMKPRTGQQLSLRVTAEFYAGTYYLAKDYMPMCPTKGTKYALDGTSKINLGTDSWTADKIKGQIEQFYGRSFTYQEIFDMCQLMTFVGSYDYMPKLIGVGNLSNVKIPNQVVTVPVDSALAGNLGLPYADPTATAAYPLPYGQTGTAVGSVRTYNPDIDAAIVGGIAADVPEIIVPGVGTGTGTAPLDLTVGGFTLNWKPLTDAMTGLTMVFPFCIPWDVKRLIEQFNAPMADKNIEIPYFNYGGQTYKLPFNLTPFEKLLALERYLVFMYFLMFLYRHTREIIRS